MRYLRCLIRLSAALALLLGGVLPALAQGTGTGQSLVVGVDYADPANQNPQQHRVFEYTDFFTRAVTVHTGDTIDFRAAPGSFHIVALAANEATARSVYPVGFIDKLDKTPAPGTGLPKIALGPSNFSITNGSTQGGGTIAQNPNGPPACGVTALKQQPCVFKGGDDIEVIGPTPGFVGAVAGPSAPAPVDQVIAINAPAGSYTYFCYIHPGMRGTLTVADSATPATTQAQIDAAAPAQFAADRDAALAAEKAADVVNFSGGAAGTRTYQVAVGLGTDHVAIDEMLPRQPLNLAAGDQVRYVWKDPHNVHTVTFPAGSQRLPEPFGFNCGTSFQNPPAGPGQGGPPCLLPGATMPDFIADPGNAPPGSALSDPAAEVDAGVLVGTGYGIQPTAQQWSLVVNGATKAGSYSYQCTVHDWMQGTLTVVAAAAVASPPAQTPAQVPAQMPNTGAGGAAPLFGGLALLGLLVAGMGALRLVPRRRDA